MRKSLSTILALETSCDETAAAVLRGSLTGKQPQFQILSSVIKSQIPLHKKTGGVVPEVAARAHMQHVLPVTEAALQQAKVNLKNIDYLAVTSGPGLIVSLIVGTEFAKGLATASGIPLLPTNHMAGHLYSAFAGNPDKIKFPIIALVVSGGHTMIIVMKDYGSIKVIGETVDDAVGEAFDKVARLLKLPYPGGPEISRLAKQGQPKIAFPRPMLQDNNFSFSFSGLKTAVLYYLDRQKQPLNRQHKADIAASFQQAAIDVLAVKTLRAAQKYRAKTIALAGGVAANQALRQRLTADSEANNLGFVMAPLELCTDNAAMIAIAAYFNLRNDYKPVSPAKVKADPLWELS